MKHLLIALSVVALCSASASAQPARGQGRSQSDQSQQAPSGPPRGAFRGQVPTESAPARQGQPAPRARGAANPNAAAQALVDQNAIANQNAARNAERGRATPGRDNGPAGAFQRGGDRTASQNPQRGRGERDFDRGNAPNRNANRDRGDRGRDFRNDRGRNDRGRVGRAERNQRYGYYRDYRGPRFSYRGRNFYSVRAPAFRYPRGWGYRHWSIGAFLPLLFLADTYYIDYDWIGLPPPPYGTRWVRYGPDALLVDTYSGEIVDVVYNVFY
jgi:hypothetical protein